VKIALSAPRFSSRRNSNCCFSFDRFNEKPSRLEFIDRKWYCFKFITYKNRDRSKKGYYFWINELLYVALESLTKRKMLIFLKRDHFFVAIDERIVFPSGVMTLGRNTEI
jgi:hypothetical protein